MKVVYCGTPVDTLIKFMLKVTVMSDIMETEVVDEMTKALEVVIVNEVPLVVTDSSMPCMIGINLS